ncbi:hypothetical protein [Paraglaciecola sp.]|uniref:hypothetical protein n=1 Tax=Paraglaciecola sp. TaxID=1920173 RepID=UPI00326767ED
MKVYSLMSAILIGSVPQNFFPIKEAYASELQNSLNSDSTSFNSRNEDVLYDEFERKKLLMQLQKISPETKANYDANNDGKVTILEQTKGRDPLSQIANSEKIVASNIKIPWSPYIYPEWISASYFQEDVSLGKVAHIGSRGTVSDVDFTQNQNQAQPQKISNKDGIEFLANSGEFLTSNGQQDARWNYRWYLMTFRIDSNTGSSNTTVLLDVNQGNSAGQSSPKIWFNKKTGLNIQYLGQAKHGLDKRLITSKHLFTDGIQWNVVVLGTRYGRVYASLNGVNIPIEQGDYYASPRSPKSRTFIGSNSSRNSKWALDALLIGTTEPSETMVKKLTGWAAQRLGFQSKLPKNHPYYAQAPVIDAEDHPHRYTHDDKTWSDWGKSLKDTGFKLSNAGKKPINTDSFERVFYDDFRNNRITRSFTNEGNLWQAPGFNTAVGASAKLALPNTFPNVYKHEAEIKQQTLSLAKKGRSWLASAFYSVNDMGHGYSWEGPKVFRIRAKFPKIPQSQLSPGLWPAFWSYGTEWLFWRTSNRIEVDWFEFDGKNSQWLNGIASHVHYSHFKNNIFAKNSNSYKSYKVYGGELTEEKSNIKGGLYFWDGQFHTWEFVVDNELTYINVTVKDDAGQEHWVEVGRSKTAPTYLERLDIQLDYALKKANKEPTTEQPFIVDFIEVLQKKEQINSFHPPFQARPEITGELQVGSTLTCQDNLQNIKDVRYYWFSDGYPLTYSSKSTYTLKAKQAGTAMRCMVKAVGALNMPEAWSKSVNIKAPF